ncbi:DJ-1/PfpI family protein [Lichenihabitans sp. Uapishka_5]|uniref:DJ-1/PfpI family protein n=1 Tax=Lichenihabitans sp. Uapishka_5 TaxID=3037302 RepID=UPI0029E810E0|nr:DJ-1/PfpI family protein [Lichenihabitans sp. Uapishka_5]MDX7953877.1 DJ-1/PfpI family protein [Lichenihabitans sp. Uapishka_5]
MTRPLTIVMPIYDGVTQLDFTGPHQFLVRVPDATIVVASMEAQPVNSHGLVFSQLTDLQGVASCDVLCVPGGSGCYQALENDRFLEQIRRLGAMATYITSVCTGSLILGAAGLLSGRKAACHWAWRDLLPLFDAIPDAGRVVRDGNIITGGGVTAGIDFALTLIEELRGIEVAQAIQLGLEYAPAPPFEAGRPDLAPPAVLATVTQGMAVAMAENRRRVEVVAAKRR